MTKLIIEFEDKEILTIFLEQIKDQIDEGFSSGILPEGSWCIKEDEWEESI